MFSKLGTEVAAEMEKILGSDAHADLFYKQASAKEEKCDCPANCACKQDGECKGACPCDKKRCKCPKGCDKCDCTESSGKCTCLKTENRKDKKDDDKKKSDALQDLSYTFSKISAQLDEAGYVKSAIAVMHAHKGLLVEAQPIEPTEAAVKQLVQEFGAEDTYALLVDLGFDKTHPDLMPDLPVEKSKEQKQEEFYDVTPEDQIPAPESREDFEPPVSHRGTRGFLSEDEHVPEMSLEDVGENVFREKLDEIQTLLDAGKDNEALVMLDELSAILEEDKTDPANLPPEDVAPTPVDEMGGYEPMTGNAPEGAPEGLGFGELESESSELDAWLQKYASLEVEFASASDPELELDLDLKDLLTAEDGVDTNLIDAYLSELDISFEDE